MAKEKTKRTFTFAGFNIELDENDDEVLEFCQEITQAVSSIPGAIAFPMTDHPGGSIHGRVRRYACFTVPKPSTRWGFNAITLADLEDEKYLALLRVVREYKDSLTDVDKTALLHDRALGMALIEAKKHFLAIRKILREAIDSEREYTMNNFITPDWISLLNALVKAILTQQNWKSLKQWKVKYWFPAVTDVEGMKPNGSCSALPDTIVITITPEHHIRFKLQIWEPYWNTNTGSRIRQCFVAMVALAFNFPDGFQGAWDLVQFRDSLNLKDYLRRPPTPTKM